MPESVFPLRDAGEKRHRTNRRQPNPGSRLIRPGVKFGDGRRGPAASVEMWQSNAAPVGTPMR
jgi:hypothetical protein